MLVGASRTRFVGELTGVRDPAERVFGGVGAAVAAYESGARILRVHGSVGAAIAAFERGARVLRVHDVAATRQALNVADAVRRAGEAAPAR